MSKLEWSGLCIYKRADEEGRVKRTIMERAEMMRA